MFQCSSSHISQVASDGQNGKWLDGYNKKGEKKGEKLLELVITLD